MRRPGHSSWAPDPLTLAVAIAAALRFWHLGQQSLWVDEVASLRTALAPLGRIAAVALRGDAFEPPGYFWLLHGVIQVMGRSEWALRLASAIVGTATIPIVWLLVRDVCRSISIANTAALLLAVNPLHIWYSQEARPYALVVCLGSAALLCLWRALQHDGIRWWAGFTVLGALAALAHLTGAVSALTGGLWALQARGTRVVRPLAFAAAGMLVLTLPFSLSLLDAVRHASGTGSPERPLTGLEVPYTLFTYLAGFSLGPSVREIHELGGTSAAAHYWGQTLLVAAVLLALAALLARARHPGRRELLTLLVVPLAATALGSIATTKAYNVRYTLPALVGFLGLAGIAVETMGPRARRFGVGAMLALFAWSDFQWFDAPRYWKDDSRTAAACLVHVLPPGSTVAVAQPGMIGVLAYYLPESAGLKLVGVGNARALDAARPDALVLSRLTYFPGLEEELVESFRRHAGRMRRGQAVGYRIYFVTALLGDGAASAKCLVP